MSILAVKKPEEKNFNYGSRSVAFFFEVVEDPLKGCWSCWNELVDGHEDTDHLRSFYDQKSSDEEAFYLIPKEFLR